MRTLEARQAADERSGVVRRRDRAAGHRRRERAAASLAEALRMETTAEGVETEAQMRAVHRQAKDLLDTLRAQGLALDTLSMGMSADLDAAIAEGSTLVRVGTAIFGKR